MSIYIIADLHLSPDTKELNQSFFNFCHNLIEGDVLYILGDFFDYFIEPDPNNSLHPLLKQHFLALKNRGIKVWFMHGNRDFLLTKKMASFFEFNLTKDNEVINSAGRRILLMHGDELCTAHKSYTHFRFISRCRLLQMLFFSCTSYNYRQHIARNMRQNSRRNFERHNCVREQINEAEARRRLKKANCDILIHGHTHHVSVIHRTDPKFSIYDTGDWSSKGYSYIKIASPNAMPEITICQLDGNPTATLN